MKRHFLPLGIVWICCITPISAQLILNVADNPNKKVTHTSTIRMMPGFKVSAINGSFYHAFIDANGDGIPDIPPPPPTPPHPVYGNENYIKSTEYLTAQGESGDKKITITYYDGLGREKQLIQVAATPSGKDILTHYEYDGFGRQAKDYLPVPSYGSQGALITDPIGLYTSYYGNPQSYNTAYFYSEKELENSPLSRVIKLAAPGDAWKLGSGHEVKMEYQTNTAGEVRFFKVNLAPGYIPSLVEKGTYESGNLYKTITKDENWKGADQSNHTVEEFKDKEGKVILKRTYDANKAHDTYYVYDLYGNLTYVLPPLLVEQLSSATFSSQPPNTEIVPQEPEFPYLPPSIGINPPISEIPNLIPIIVPFENAPSLQTLLDNLGYQYQYDERNRLVEKQLPGKGREYLVYDKQNRLVATQDSEQRKSGKGLFTKYDRFGREIITGETTFGSSREAVQTQVNGMESNNEERADSSLSGITAFYTNNKAFPIIQNPEKEIITIKYYDSYVNTGAPTISTVENQNVLGTMDSRLRGTETASYVKILKENSVGIGNWTYTYYDSKVRPIRILTQNYLGGFTQVDSKLEGFRGKTEYAVTTHSRDTQNAELTIKESFTYDKQERLLTHTHQVNEGKIEYLSQNVYDELGRIKNKKVGGLLPGAGLQQVDYEYNIRGWLTGINNLKNLSPANQPMDLFAFSLHYEQVIQNASGNVVPLYNGNIAETYWVSASDHIERGYGYQYDSMNRLLRAYYNKEGYITNAYDEKLSYDANGNILSLLRYGEQDIHTNTILIDELEYTYSPSSNYLLGVKDVSNNPAGFSQGKISGNGFSYDTNGNMTQDLYKGISSILYNFQNLPSKITSSQGEIEYLYEATGTKLAKVVKKGNNITTTDYLNGFQYKNHVLEFFPHAEGYYDYTLKTYVYHYTDLSGNIRLSYRQNPANGSLEILEENHYYPFGLKHSGYNNNNLQPEYKYKYNGKELQTELDLNVISMDFRQYDMTLGRFTSIDRLAELAPHTNPYRFAFNNPVYWCDPSGLFETKKEARAYRKEKKIKGSIRKNKDGSYRIDDKRNLVSYTKGEDGTSENFRNDGVEESVLIEGNKNKSEALEAAKFANDRIGDVGTYLKYTPKKGGSFRLRNGIKNGNKFSPKYYPSNWLGGSKAMIKTYNVAKTISRGSVFGTAVLGSIEVGIGVSQDYDNYQNEGHTNGKNTAVAVGSVAGGLIGSFVGGEVLGTFGSAFGPEGTAIGIIVGNYAGGYYGSKIGENLVEKAYE